MADEASRFDRAYDAGDDAVWPAPLASVELGHPISLETWGTADEVVAHHCGLGLSGTLRIDGDPGVRVYLHDGLVYFAERTTDPELGFRLVLDGVISEDQLVHGTRLLEGGRHLGRMFANDPSIDRQRVVDEVVGYCTDAVASLDGRTVSTYAFLPDEHHSSGILAWYSLEDDFDGPSPAVLIPDAAVLAPAEAVAPALVPAAAVSVEQMEDDFALIVAEPRLPRRSRFIDSIPLSTDGGLGQVDISALQAAMTSIRASNTATITMTTREIAAPAVGVDAAVATEKVPGSPAERRYWVARRHR